jgi:hypothetical protein
MQRFKKEPAFVGELSNKLASAALTTANQKISSEYANVKRDDYFSNVDFSDVPIKISTYLSESPAHGILGNVDGGNYWNLKADMITSHSDCGGFPLDGDKQVVFGGVGTANGEITEVYMDSINVWVLKANMPRKIHKMGTLYIPITSGETNLRGLSVCGIDLDTREYINISYLYSYSSNTWIPKNNPVATNGISNCTCLTTSTGGILVGGILSSGEILNTCYIMNSNFEWASLGTPYPTAIYKASALSFNNSPTVVGGETASDIRTDAMYKYNSSNGTWESIQSYFSTAITALNSNSGMSSTIFSDNLGMLTSGEAIPPGGSDIEYGMSMLYDNTRKMWYLKTAPLIIRKTAIMTPQSSTNSFLFGGASTREELYLNGAEKYNTGLYTYGYYVLSGAANTILFSNIDNNYIIPPTKSVGVSSLELARSEYIPPSAIMTALYDGPTPEPEISLDDGINYYNKSVLDHTMDLSDVSPYQADGVRDYILRIKLGLPLISSVWTQKTAMNVPRSSCGGFQLGYDRGMICGGYNDSSYLSSTEKYSSSSNCWTITSDIEGFNPAVAPSLLQCSRMGSLVIANGRGLLYGGTNTSGNIAGFSKLYGESGNSWQTRSFYLPLGTGESVVDCGSASLTDSVGLNIGGRIGANFNDYIYEYSYLVDVWAQLTSFGTTLYGCSSNGLTNNIALTTGGIDDENTYNKIVYITTIAPPISFSVLSMNIARSFSAMSSPNNSTTITSGGETALNTYTNKTEILNTNISSTLMSVDIPSARSKFSSVLTNNSMYSYFMGGYDGTNHLSQNVMFTYNESVIYGLAFTNTLKETSRGRI